MTTKVPENVVRFRAGVDVGSTQTRLLVEGVDAENKTVYNNQVVISSEVGIVKDDLAAKMATKRAKTRKEIYGTPTIAGKEVPVYRNSIDVTYPAKAGSMTKNSLIALERVLDDVFEELTSYKKPIWAGIGVPTEFTRTEYRDVVIGKILPRVINRNGQTDNRDITAAEAFFEACAIRAADVDDDIDLGRLCLNSIGGGTTNLYIADGIAPNEDNSLSFGFAGRDLTERFRKYVLEDNPDAKMDFGYAEKLLCGEAEGHKNVRAMISGFDKPDKVPTLTVPIDIAGVYRERNVGRAMDRAVRDLFEKNYESVLELLRKYQGEVKPVTFVYTGRAGQIHGLDKALEDGLHRAHFTDAQVYNLSKFKKGNKQLFEPNLLVAQGALEAAHEAESDPNFKWHYLMPK